MALRDFLQDNSGAIKFGSGFNSLMGGNPVNNAILQTSLTKSRGQLPGGPQANKNAENPSGTPNYVPGLQGLQGADYFSHVYKTSQNPQMKSAALNWLIRNGISQDTPPTNDLGIADVSNADLAHTAGVIGQAYSGYTDADLWALRNKLKRQASQAEAGSLPAEEFMVNNAGLNGGEAKYTYDQLDRLNRATGNIFDAQVGELDDFMDKRGSGTSGNQMTDNERALQTLFQSNPIVKDYNTVISQKNSIDAIVKNGAGGPADVAAIFSFMKALDPNSVVRESEYDKAAKSGNLFKGYAAKFNGYFKDKGGFLPSNVQQEFQNLINQKLNAQAIQYNNYANQTKEIATRQGMNPDNVVIDFSGGIGGDTQSGGGGGSRFIRQPDGTYRLQSFNNVGSGTNQASRVGSLSDAMRRIARNESPSGNYRELGPVVKSGQYKGQRALGKYQVMPGNVSAWSKEALGYAISPQQFLQSPELQEKIVAHQMSQIYRKYGNWSDVASVWFTGRPLAQGKNAKDVLGTSGSEYVRRFNA